MSAISTPFSQSFFHGAKVDLEPGDLIGPGFASNYGQRRTAIWVYLTATLDAAIWGAELAQGQQAGRIYVVEPTGPIENDPNLTDKKFPGNPTLSYRSRHPLRIVGEVTGWTGHPIERIEARRDRLAEWARLGAEIIED